VVGRAWPTTAGAVATVTVVTRRARLTLVAAFLLAGAVSACGVSNGGDVKSADYAKAVCSGLLTWRQSVSGDSSRLSQALQAGASDVTTVKTKYTAFYQGVVRRTDALLTAVDKAGAPKIDNGLSYAHDLTAALTQTRTGLANAQRRFAALPVNDLRSYAAGAAKIRDDLGTVFLGVGTTLDQLGRTYPDKGLNKAFEDQTECKSLT
jgi:hypothetical protein